MPVGPSLEELLARVALRDQAAYEALYRATSGKLFGFVLRILRRQDLAEDCLQDAFVSIWYRAGDYRPERAAAFTWMAAIARNRALVILGTASNVREIADGQEREEVDAGVVDAGDALEAGDDARALMRCLEGVPAT